MIKRVWRIYIFFVLAIFNISGSYALFNETEESISNNFQALRFDLLLSDADEENVTSLSNAIGASNIIPDQELEGEFIMRFSDDILNLNADVQFSTENEDPLLTVDDKFELLELSLNSTSVLDRVSDSNSNGYLDLYDLTTVTLDGLLLQFPNTDYKFYLKVKANSLLPNSYRGLSCNLRADVVIYNQ